MARRGSPNRSKGPRRMRRNEPVTQRRSKYLDEVKTIDTNDAEFLRQFVTEHGKIMPARLTGASAKEQRQIKQGIRRVRVIGLLG
jgi:small subunit ribosomal protein S18